MVKKSKMRDDTPGLPPTVYAEVSVKSVGGRSLFEETNLVTSENVAGFLSEGALVRRAVERLRAEGFDILNVGDVTITIGAPPEKYEEVFNTRLGIVQHEVIKGGGATDIAEFVECSDGHVQGLIDTSRTPLGDLIEGVAINEPVYYFSETMEAEAEGALADRPGFFAGEKVLAPTKDYWHLKVPGDVSVGMNADRAHRAGYTGKGISVVMVDSGWYRHPYFVDRGYRSDPVVLGPATSNPSDDENGHGTGESANVFAVAPDVKFRMVKINFVNSVGAFNAAAALNPHIISCSWGSSVRNGPLSAANQTLAAAVASAVKKGITVVFSAGNGHWGFPGQHPDVISAGGVYIEPDGSLRASNYASGFTSNVYPGRRVPDVCGLVGLQPRAQYIMLPVRAGCSLDVQLAGGTHPNGDQTAGNDGWAAFSGTSAAAPQIAGICALMKQACKRLTPAQLRGVLRTTARDVTAGNCHGNTGGHPATGGPDLATGHGLADAHRAVLIARLRCLLRPPIVLPRPIPQPVVPIAEPTGEGDLSEEEYEALEEFVLSSVD